jgi:multidrug resistance efflux pump
MDAALALAEEDSLRARREERYVRAALDRALHDLEDSKAELEDSKAELEGLRAKLEVAEALAVQASDSPPPVPDSSARPRNRALQKRAKNERRRRRALERSLSWRITRPLRVAHAALAHPRRGLRALVSARSRGSAQ